MQAISWCARFMNAPDTGIEFAINTQFTQKSFDPQALTALVGAWQAGRVPSSDVTINLQKMGIISAEKTPEQVADELSVDGAGLALDVNEAVDDGSAPSVD
jgi:hypothetical protein